MAELQNPSFSTIGTTPSMGYNNLAFVASKPVVFHRNDLYVGGKRVSVPEARKAPVTSAAAAILHGKPVALFTTRHGVGIASAEGELLGWLLAGGEVDLRGVVATCETTVAYGSASGQVVFVEVGADFSEKSVVVTEAHSAAVTTIVQGTRGLYSADTDGMICIFSGTEVKTKAVSDGDCCTAITEHDCGLITAHGSGDLRVRGITGQVRAQVTAHSRWVTGLSTDGNGKFASVSEDNVLAVWELGLDTVKFVAYRTHLNQLLTGCAMEDGSVMCVAYDSDALISYAL